ncbi:MAG TPA: flagellar biosynthetic protein FliR [Gammaproteobacteria bacterium]|nr:flagellar biosynthetic protein FliR [Gammaproteobacteria bacterium]
MHFTAAQIMSLLGAYVWPFTRIGAMVSVAPILGTHSVPMRIRLGLAIALTMVIAPMVPPIRGIALFSIAGVIVTFQQFLIGLAIGFSVRLVFSAMETGGNAVANLMGLGFANVVDPQNGVQVPVLSQFFTTLAALLFLSLDGHLVLVQVMTDSFRTLPVGITGLSRGGVWQLVSWAGWIFTGGVLIALPAIAALLIVNVSFGVMTRAAPQLNIFAVGFPITLILGFVVLTATLPTIAPKFTDLVSRSFDLTRFLVRPGG